MSFITKMASEIGKAVAAYHLAQCQVNARRPGFLSSMAEERKWNGGQLGARDAAQRRAIQSSWVYTAINRKAMDVSAAQLYVEYNPEGLEDTGKPVRGHPYLQIMRRPNPVMSPSFLWQYTHWWQDLDGNSYWFLAPDGWGELAEIWPLPAGMCRAFPGDKERFVDYYEYQANGRIYQIPAEYICHFQYPNPFDLFHGLSPLVAGMLPVDADLAMAKWNGQFFSSDNVMPSAVISLGSGNPQAPIDQADIDKVAEELRSDYGASRRKTVITNAQEMAAQLLGWSAKDMDFLNGRNFGKEEIYQIFGLPLGMMDKNVTEANATVSDNIYKEKTLWTLLGLYAGQQTAQITIPFYGEGYHVKYRDIRPVLRQLDLQEASVSANDLTIDERRKRYWKLPPLPNGRGDKLASEVQTPMFSNFDTFGDQVDNPTNSIPDKQPNAIQELRLWRGKAIKSINSGKGAAVGFTSEAIPPELKAFIGASLECAETAEDVKAIFDLAKSRKGIIRSWRPWSAFEERMASEMEGILRGQNEALLGKLREQGDAAALEDAETWRKLAEEMRQQIEPTLLDLAKYAAGRVQTTLGASAVDVSWDLANERAVNWAKQHAGDLVTKVTETTKRAVGEQVSQWSSSSEGLDGLIRRIEGMKDEAGAPIFNAARAETIAVTEATNTYASANAEAWTAAGYQPAAYKPAAHVRCRCYLQPYKMPDGTKVLVWYTARDERVCEQPLQTPWGGVQGCKELHQTVVSEGAYLGKKVS